MRFVGLYVFVFLVDTYVCMYVSVCIAHAWTYMYMFMLQCVHFVLAGSSLSSPEAIVVSATNGQRKQEPLIEDNRNDSKVHMDVASENSKTSLLF